MKENCTKKLLLLFFVFVFWKGGDRDYVAFRTGMGVRDWTSWWGHGCLCRLEDRDRRVLGVTVPVGSWRLVEGFGETRDGRSSCAPVPGRMGDWTDGDWGCVRDAGATDARLWVSVLEALCVAFGAVASSVNHIGWYRLRAMVARMRLMVLMCVWGTPCVVHGSRG